MKNFLIAVANRLFLCLTTLVPCTMVFTWRILKDTTEGTNLALVSTLIAGVPLILLVIHVWPICPPPITILRLYLRTSSYVLCTLVFLSVGYIQSQMTSGGDTDPIKFLEGKTTYAGGYQYLVKKTTYREYKVSGEPFFQHSFSEYKILQHIPAIMKIKDYSVSVGLGHFGMHSPQVTMTLSNAVIHVPYNDLRLTKFFQDHSDSRGALEFLSTQYLKHLADPIFKRLQEYPPDTGSFGFDLSREHYSLDDLEEKYGIHIVTLPNELAHLSFTITYSRPPNPDAPLFRQNEIEEMLSSP